MPRRPRRSVRSIHGVLCIVAPTRYTRRSSQYSTSACTEYRDRRNTSFDSAHGRLHVHATCHMPPAGRVASLPPPPTQVLERVAAAYRPVSTPSRTSQPTSSPSRREKKKFRSRMPCAVFRVSCQKPDPRYILLACAEARQRNSALLSVFVQADK